MTNRLSSGQIKPCLNGDSDDDYKNNNNNKGCIFNVACKQVYNIFQAIDVLGYRIEPNLDKSYRATNAIHLPFFSDYPYGVGDAPMINAAAVAATAAATTATATAIATATATTTTAATTAAATNTPNSQLQKYKTAKATKTTSLSPFQQQMQLLDNKSSHMFHSANDISLATNYTSPENWWGKRRVDIAIKSSQAVHLSLLARIYATGENYLQSKELMAFLLRSLSSTYGNANCTEMQLCNNTSTDALNTIRVTQSDYDRGTRLGKINSNGMDGLCRAGSGSLPISSTGGSVDGKEMNHAHAIASFIPSSPAGHFKKRGKHTQQRLAISMSLC